jgi:tRNA G18 (ribose-2'-O)-methylase SpoU
VEQTDASVALQDFKALANTKYALIFGNEVNGLSESILPLLDACIEIPQFGTKHSLNVSVSGGVVLWHFMLQILKE